MRVKAVKILNSGQSSNDLGFEDLDLGPLAPDQVRIKTAFAGVNRPDILQRKGLYPAPVEASPILGLEVSGEIIAIGDAVTAYSVGERVCALTNGGGYAEAVDVPIGQVLPVPQGWAMAAAATLPEAALTVFANLIEAGALCAGETVLVHGANSGIGAMTIQMAKAYGAKVIATARGRDKCAFASKMGADLVIDTQTDDFVVATKAFGGADVILDILGGAVTAQNILCLKPKGRLVQVGVQLGGEVTLDLRRIMQKQAVLTGSMLRPRSTAEKARLCQVVILSLYPIIEQGLIKPCVDKMFAFDEVSLAHAYLEGRQQLGKVVLRF